MNDSALEPLTPEQERVREELERLPSPPADADFRAALRSGFVSGRLRERETGRPIESALRRSAREWVRAPAVRWAGIPLAFAALFVVASILNRAPDWTISAASGLGVAVVDGRPVPMNHMEELERVMRAGTRVHVPEGSELELMGPGQMVVQLTPGTDFTVPAAPGRWWARRVRAEVRAGELRITTGPRFHGARLAISTPDARVEVTGTTLAVICDPEGTCVCVLEGRVRVGAHEGDMYGVEAGHLRFVYSDGRESKVAEMREIEAVKLAELRAQRAPALEAPGH